MVPVKRRSPVLVRVVLPATPAVGVVPIFATEMPTPVAEIDVSGVIDPIACEKVTLPEPAVMVTADAPSKVLAKETPPVPAEVLSVMAAMGIVTAPVQEMPRRAVTDRNETGPGPFCVKAPSSVVVGGMVSVP